MPFVNQIHVDKPLSNISIKYRNANLIAMDVFPELQVKKDSDLYYIFDRDFRLPETNRANKAEARQHSYQLSTSSYVLEEHALVDYISDRDAANYDLGGMRADVTEELTDKILLRLEKSVADLFTSTSWSQNVSLSTAQQWSLDTVTFNPIPLMDTAATTVLENSGLAPNFSIVPHSVMIKAKNHSSIIERIKYTQTAVTEQMLASLFGTEKMLVPKAVIDSGNEGATSTVAAVWGDNVFVGYKAPRPSVRKASCGYIFRSSQPLAKRWREEKRSSEAIEVGMRYQPKVVASLAGYLLKDALA